MALENILPLFQSVSAEVDEKDKLMKENPLSVLDKLIPYILAQAPETRWTID
ncbi:hypothetical protein KSP39_PZI016162 [Platanthera zijinensis]|uniref:Uncharacterized protein n=1 Tax=Platanthera zijinensis TaxID=2320716 RepID=A0AAP0G0E1_9ASPA